MNNRASPPGGAKDLRSRPQLLEESSDFERALLEGVGEVYQARHPFMVKFVEGSLTPSQLRGWATNWYYFELNMPRKDAAVISNCQDPSVRRLWATKILEQDGSDQEEGAIAGWLRFTETLGLPRKKVEGAVYLEGVVRAVEDYITFAKEKTWLEGVATSVGMVFLPGLVLRRLAAFQNSYPWVDSRGLGYFRRLYAKSRRDGRLALRLVTSTATTPQARRASYRAALFGSEVQRRILDAIYRRYVTGKTA